MLGDGFSFPSEDYRTMTPAIDDTIRRKARFPHELLMMNLAAFHLLLAPAAIALGIGFWGLLLTPLFSGMVLLYIYLRGKRAERSGPWLVMAHWKLAWRRSLLLIISYGVSAVIIGGGMLIASGVADHGMRNIIDTIATRIGVMPTVIMVLACFVLSNSGLDFANKGEVPEGIKRRFPAPADSAA